VVPQRLKSSRPKRKQSEGEEKGEKLSSSGKIDERIRLAAKGVRQPVMGELSSSKVLQELREGGRAKKAFFLCC
jgi:hypothetical protein